MKVWLLLLRPSGIMTIANLCLRINVVICAAEALKDHNYSKRKPEDQSCDEPPLKVARTDGPELDEVTDDVNDSLPPHNIPTPLSEQGELFAELMCLFCQSLTKQSNQRNKAYSDAIRKFSVTMYTYSPKVYRLVCKKIMFYF